VKNKLLIYAPYSGVPQYSFPLAKMAKGLATQGFEVDLLTCNGLQQPTCILQISHHYELLEPEKKNAICKWCTAYAMEQKDFFSKVLFLDNHYLCESEMQMIEATTEKLEVQDIEDFKIEEVPIARLACYNFFLRFQILAPSQISEEQFKIYKQHYFKSTLTTFIGYSNFLKQRNYTEVLIGDANYSQNQVVFRINQLRGVQTFSTFSTYHHKYVWDQYGLCQGDDVIRYRAKALQGFKKDDGPFYKEGERLALDYVNTLWNKQAKTIFSTPKEDNLSEVIDTCAITDKHKKVVLLVSSSLDEALATEFSIYESDLWSRYNPLFENQVQWMEACIQYFSDRKDTKLIIRCHPREYIVGKSATARAIEALSEKYQFENIYFNFPEDKISIFDLLDLTDICLIRASTVGLEASLLGIPVVSYMNYLDPLCFCPENKTEYFAKITDLLGKGNCRDFQLALEMYKWLMFFYHKGIIRMDSKGYWELFPENTAKANAIKEERKKQNLPVMQIKEFDTRTNLDSISLQVLAKAFGSQSKTWDIFDSVTDEVALDNDDLAPASVIQKLILAIYRKDIHIFKDLETLRTNSGQNKTKAFFLEALNLI